MRRLIAIAALLAASAALIAASAGADDSHTYKIEMYNAFGIVKGSDVRVGGVNAGTVTDLGITPEKRAVVTVELSGPVSVLGKDTHCSSEPQSLIAEYFIDCNPKGPPLPDGGVIPASHVTQTVQSDLVQNTLRLPFAQRLQLLINEFGTALAGNPHDLNQAIRLGAPALRNLKRALDILASENATIRDLNANSDTIIRQLAARHDDVVRFIQNAGRTAAISSQREADLSRNFDLLDNFLHQLRPTLAKLSEFAGANAQPIAPGQGSLLQNLRAAAPGLNTLAVNLPAFNHATDVSLKSLGRAAKPGTAAFRTIARNRILAKLRASGRNAFPTANTLDKFLLDIASPKRHVETDARAAYHCPPGTAHPKTKPCYSTGRKAPTGYTGMEGLLNYVYYQTGALNQFDQAGHLLHFSLFDVGQSPCGNYNAGDNPSDSSHTIGVPSASGGTTTNILAAAPCVSWLGPNQPGISQEPGINQISPYDPSVCPSGSTDPQLCSPSGGSPKRGPAKPGSRGAGPAAQPTAPAPNAGQGTAPPSQGGGPLPQLPPSPLPHGGHLPGGLDDLLGLGHHRHRHRHGGLLGGGGGGGGALGGDATRNLLDFLLGD